MKIVFFRNEMYNSGGMGRVLSERINLLVEKYNYDIYIIILNQKEKNLFYNLNNQVKIIDLKLNYETNILKKILIELKYILKVKEVLKKIKPSILVSLGELDTFFLWIFKNKNLNVIREYHFNRRHRLFVKNTTKINKLKNYMTTILEEILLKKYDKFVVLTEEDKEQWLKEENIKNIEVIPNPLPFYPNKISNCEDKTIISVGRLEEQKGYDELIEVWNKLFKKYSDWKLEIYGEGSLRKELQAKIDKLGMTNSLLLKGTDKNIMERYLESSIYVMSSRYEGMPMVLLETMACGLPVVSFDCPCGPKDIIRDGEDGFLIKNRNLDEMVNKLEFLMKNEKVRKIMGKKAHDNIIRYSQEEIIKKWRDIYGK